MKMIYTNKLSLVSLIKSNKLILITFLISTSLCFACNDGRKKKDRLTIVPENTAQKKQESKNEGTNENLFKNFYKNLNKRYFVTKFTALSYNNDDTKIVTGDENGNIIIWDSESLIPIDSITNAHKHEIKQVFFDPINERYFLSFDKTSIKVWDIFYRGSFVRELPIKGQSIALNKNKVLAVGYNCKVDLYHFLHDPFSKENQFIGTAINSTFGFSDVKAIALSENSNLLACYSECFGLKIWKLDGVNEFPKSGGGLIGEGLKRWNGENNLITLYSEGETDISSVVFSPDSKYLAVVDNKNLQVVVFTVEDILLTGGKFKQSIFKFKKSENSNNTKLDFSKNSQYLILTGVQKEGCIFDIEKQLIFNIFYSEFEFIDAKFNNQDFQFTSIDKGGDLKTWNLNSSLEAPINQITSLPIPSATLSYQSVFLPFSFEISTDGTIKLVSKENLSYVTPIGTFKLGMGLNLYNQEQPEMSKNPENLLILFKNRDLQTESLYVIKGGKGLNAEIEGEIIISAVNSRITIDITKATSIVRFRND